MKTHNRKKSFFRRMGAAVLATMVATMSIGLVSYAGDDESAAASEAPAVTEAPASSASAYSKDVTFTSVETGDSIYAYKLVAYDSSYNNYTLETSFNTYVDSYRNGARSSAVDYIEHLTNSEMAVLINKYAAAAQDASNETYTLPAAETSGTAADSKVTLTLDAGYYMILGETTATNKKLYSPTSVFIKPEGTTVKVYAGANDKVAEITTSPIVAMKSEQAPTMDKLSKNPAHEGETWSREITSDAGETVEFRIQIDIPAFKDGTELNMKLNDTMHNLQYVTDSIKVYSDAACTNELEGAIVKTTAGAYDTTTNNQTMTVEFDFDKIHPVTATSSVIYVYYKATVMAKTEEDNHDISNKADVEYSNKATPDNTSKTEEKETEVDTYVFELDKVNESGQPLTGAGFTFYNTADGTTPITFSKNDDGTYRPDTEGSVTEIMCDTDGKIRITGVDLGTYYAQETTVPTGYYAPAGRFEIELVANANDSEALDVEQTRVTSVENADSVLIETTKTGVDSTGAIFILTLKNSQTPILPETGGMGTIAFSIIGIAMMAAAGGMMVIRKRRVNAK
jgi:LPXTG-motif cell wall-anchored protein